MSFRINGRPGPPVFAVPTSALSHGHKKLRLGKWVRTALHDDFSWILKLKSHLRCRVSFLLLHPSLLCGQYQTTESAPSTSEIRDLSRRSGLVTSTWRAGRKSPHGPCVGYRGTGIGSGHINDDLKSKLSSGDATNCLFWDRRPCVCRDLSVSN